MIQENYFTALPDIQNHFEKLIDWSQIVESYEQNFQDHKEYKESNNELLALAPSNVKEAKESYKICLESIGELVGKVVAPCAAEMDKEGLKFNNGRVVFPKAMQNCYAKMLETGSSCYGISRRHGGIGLPSTAQSILLEVMARADSSFCLAAGTPNIAEIVERYADEKIVKEWIPRVAKGELWSAMALTEPNYGSDLPNITTRAEQDAKGKWLLNGTKRFITHACGFNDIPALIVSLARTAKPGSGARGLSLFIVEGTDVEIPSIEKKLGLTCSPTCEVVYEDTPGILIGKEGLGLVKYAIGMMNGARLAVASQSMGVAQAAVSEAKKYASERMQFGRLIKDIPAVRKTIRFMDRELLAMRCLLYEASHCLDLYQWPKLQIERKAKSPSEVAHGSEIRKWEKLANFYTPLAKYYLSEMCNRLAYDGLQLLGGSGYTEDYDLARIYRDARITNIYEGTTHLQIVAAIGGISAGMAPKGYLREYIGEEMQKFSASPALQELYKDFDNISTRFRQIKNSEKRDELAFEAVESAARFLCSMLLERSLTKFSGQEAEERNSFVQEFNIDSQAILKANLFRIKALHS